jgi:hypothetical protein
MAPTQLAKLPQVATPIAHDAIVPHVWCGSQVSVP